MGQRIIVGNIAYLHQTIKQQYTNMVNESERISKIFKKAALESNQLNSKYYKIWTSLQTGREILYEKGSPQQIGKVEQEYKEKLLQYFEEKEAQYVLKLLQNKRKEAKGQKRGQKQSYSFKYLPGRGNDIVLFKYTVCSSELNIDKIKDNIILYCYSIEIFDKQRLPLCLRTTFDSLANRQRQQIRDTIQQTQQSGALAQFLKNESNIDEKQLRQKAKDQGIMISFVELMSK